MKIIVDFIEQCLHLHKLTDQVDVESKELYEKCGGLVLDIAGAYHDNFELKNRLSQQFV